MKKGNKDKQNSHFTRFKGLKIFGFFVILLEVIILIFSFLNPIKWKRFIKNEKREIKELVTGQEDLKRFWNDSRNLIKDIFIPHEANNHQPKALRPKSLGIYILFALLVKLTVTGFLFTTYPSEAELSVIVSANMVSLIN